MEENNDFVKVAHFFFKLINVQHRRHYENVLDFFFSLNHNTIVSAYLLFNNQFKFNISVNYILIKLLYKETLLSILIFCYGYNKDLCLGLCTFLIFSFTLSGTNILI